MRGGNGSVIGFEASEREADFSSLTDFRRLVCKSDRMIHISAAD